MGVDLWRIERNRRYLRQFPEVLHRTNVRVCSESQALCATELKTSAVSLRVRNGDLVQEFGSYSCSEKLLEGRHAFHVMTNEAAVLLTLFYLSLYRCFVTHRNVLSQGWEGFTRVGHICQLTWICVYFMKCPRERQVSSPDQATSEGSSCTNIMTCTGGCGYSF